MYHPPPDFQQCIYTPHRVSAVVAELVAQGGPAALALAGTGLDASQLESPATRISYRQIETVFRNGLRLSNDPMFVIRAAQRMHVTAYGMYGYAILSSRTPLESMDFGVKYHRIVGPVADIAYERDGATVVYVYEPLLWLDPADELYRVGVEFVMASHLTVMRDVHGKTFKPLRARLAYAAPPHGRRYRAALGCPVAFGQGRNELHFDAVWLDRPMPLADPVTHAFAHELCDQLLGELDRGAGVAPQVRRALFHNPGKFPTIEAMAGELSMPAWALRRRLAGEGTSYRQLLDEIRKRLALEYLRKTQLTNEEISSRLGYSDVANFRHAFARWTGKSPSEFRGA